MKQNIWLSTYAHNYCFMLRCVADIAVPPVWLGPIRDLPGTL